MSLSFKGMKCYGCIMGNHNAQASCNYKEVEKPFWKS